ncbi:hypothetical protein JCM8097_003024 [Rhodosporidiobolus ruineniae]
MRLSSLPLPLALTLLSACSLSSASFAPLPPNSLSSSLQPAQPHSTALSVRPRFLPPDNYPRRKRQDVSVGGIGSTGDDTSSGSTTGADAGSDTTQQTSDTQQTTTAAQDTTTAAQQITTQATSAAETTSAATTTSPAQQTTEQQTSNTQATTTTAAQTSDSNSPTSDPAATPSSSGSSAASSAPSDSASSGSPTSAPSGSSTKNAPSSTISSVEITFTSLFTNSDGSVSTSTGTTQTPTAVPIKQNNSGSSKGKTWGIIGGVVGGVVVVAAIVFVVYRMTQRRFSSLDDEDAIVWPELQQDGGLISANTSTLKPLETRARDGHGVGDDGDGASEWGGGGAGDLGAGSIYGAGAAGHKRRESQGTLLGYNANQHSRQASYEALAMADSGGYGAAGAGQHYDPFLGPAAYPPLHAAGGIVYPPTPPQQGYLPPGAGAYGSPGSHRSSPSVDSHGVSRGPSAGDASYSSHYPPPPSSPPRLGSPELGARTEQPFRVPSPEFEKGLGIDLPSAGAEDEKEGEKRGPL